MACRLQYCLTRVTGELVTRKNCPRIAPISGVNTLVNCTAIFLIIKRIELMKNDNVYFQIL